MPFAHLTDRSAFRLSGDDAIPFLQGLITNDATRLARGEPLYAALLSPQGKFLHDFFLVPHEGAILLDTNKEKAPDLIKRLTIYRLRSKVLIEPVEMEVWALWDVDPSSEFFFIEDPRHELLGDRLYSPRPTQQAEPADYEAHRIALGIPDGAKDMKFEKSLLLEFHFEALHGVSFSKGCYVGQEVTARSKFRGQVRKQLYQIFAGSALPPHGTEVMADGRPVGELLSVSGAQGLALLRSEELQNAQNVTANEIRLECTLPAWAEP